MYGHSEFYGRFCDSVCTKALQCTPRALQPWSVCTRALQRTPRALRTGASGSVRSQIFCRNKKSGGSK